MQTNPETKTKPKSEIKNSIHGLYVIADTSILNGSDLVNGVEQATSGGAAIVQLRDKSSSASDRKNLALTLKKICADKNVIFLINDDALLAKNINADGVHIGKEDLSIQETRAVVGAQAIIGVSCYNQLSLAEDAQKQGADYIAFGSFFNSPTKPEAVPASLALVEKANTVINIPMVAIGGITPDNTAPLMRAGISAIAAASGVIGQDNIRKAAANYCKHFKLN